MTKMTKSDTETVLWRQIKGAVKKAFDHHPEYLTDDMSDRKDQVINSITKRVYGDLRSSRKGEPVSAG